MPPIIPAGSPAAGAATVPAGTIPPGMMPMKRPAKPGPQAKPAQAPKQAQPQQPQQAAPGQQPAPQQQQQPQQPQAPQQGQPAAPQQPQQQPQQGPAFAPPPPGVTRDKNGPVPGQSLTSHGNYPYEKPPKYTDPDKAMVAILNSFTDEKTCPKILNMMEIGVPLYPICMSFMMQGFTEGMWTMDLGLLLLEPMTALLIRMAQAAKIEPEIGAPEDEDGTMEAVLQHRAKISKEQVDAAQDAAISSGILSRPKKAR